MPSVLFTISRLHCMDGIASHLDTLLPALRRNGWTPHLVIGLVDAPPETVARLDRLKGAAETFVVDPRLACVGRRTPWEVAQQSRILKDHIRETGAQIVHLQGRALGPAAWLSTRGTKTRVVNTCQLAVTHDQLKPTLASSLLGRFYGDRAISISHEVGQTLTSGWGVPLHRIRTVFHGVDVTQFAPPSNEERARARARLGLSPDAFVAVQVARVAQIKRPETFVEAVLKLRAAGYNCVGLLAGHIEAAIGKQLASTITRARAEHHVRLLGHADPRLVLHSADAKVLASEREGFPISIVEAMACGVVPLRTPVEGAKEQIEDGANGFLFPLGDACCLASRLELLIKDVKTRGAMASKARETAVTRLSSDVMALKTIAVYEEVLNTGYSRG